MPSMFHPGRINGAQRMIGMVPEALVLKPTRKRGAGSVEGQVSTLREGLGATGRGSRAPGRNERVRVFRASPLRGPASAIDGDTVDVGGVLVRLHGVDAPESAQSCRSAGGGRWPCGREAARALAEQVDGELLACEERDRDAYGRVVAACRVRGQDLNAWMVAQGWPLAYLPYATDYVGLESQARAAGWRRSRRKTVPSYLVTIPTSPRGS